MNERPPSWWFRALNVLLAGVPDYVRVQRRVEDGYAAATGRILSDPAVRALAERAELTDLEHCYHAENDRCRGIEEKARTNLLAITLGLTILVGSPTSLLARLHEPLAARWGNWAILGLLVLAAASFLWAGWVALAAFRLRQWHVLTPEERLEPLARRKERLWCYIELNQRVTTLRGNALAASFDGIRYGMCALGALLLWVAVLAAALPARAPQSTSPVSASVAVPVANDSARGTRAPLAITLQRPTGDVQLWHIDRIQTQAAGEALWKVLLGGALAIIGGLAAQHYRGRQERRWAKERLVARIRSALETAAAVSRSAVKKDETREINPEVMREIILAWQRYDRVADEVHLLRTPQFEEVVDATLSQARMIAEKILEDERRFKVTARETGTMTKQGIDLDPGILAKMHVQRKALLQLLRDSGGRCEAVLERFNAKWRPARWHAPREAPPAMPHDSVGDTAASSPEHREVP